MATLTRDEFIIAAADGVRTADELGALWDSYQPGSNGSAPSAGQIVTLADYLANIPKVIPWIVGGFVFEHGVTLVTGLPKAGKSTLVVEIMRCLGTPGASFLERLAAQRPVLLVTEESGVPVGFKMHALDGLDIYVYDRRAAAGESFEHTLLKINAWVAEHPGGIVVIDTFAVWATVDDENDASKVTKAMNDINALAQTADCAVVLVHHQRKGGGSNGEGVRGSGALVASVDILVEVTRPDDDPLTTQRTLNIMGRVGSPEHFAVDFDTETRRYDLVDETAEFLEHLEEWLEGMPVWLGSREASGPGMTRPAVYKLWDVEKGDKRLNKIVAKGRIHKDDGVPQGRGISYKYWAIPPAIV